MTKPTVKAAQFMLANDKSGVVSGCAYERGGGRYTLHDGQSFKLSVEDCRSLPDDYPKWRFT